MASRIDNLEYIKVQLPGKMGSEKEVLGMRGKWVAG
jgi:hypothetical protein